MTPPRETPEQRDRRQASLYSVGTALMDSIMRGKQPASHRPAAIAAPKTGPVRQGSTGGQSRAIRRARKADRTKKVEKINAQRARLQREHRDRLETAAALANVYFAGPVDSPHKNGISAYARVKARVDRQAEQLVAGGKATDVADAVEQNEKSMASTLQQYTEMQRSAR